MLSCRFSLKNIQTFDLIFKNNCNSKNDRYIHSFISLQSSSMWLAVSSARSKLYQMQTELDELKFLKTFGRKCKDENAALEELLEVLPKLVEQSKKLSDELSQGQNYLKISGVLVKQQDIGGIQKIMLERMEDLNSILQKANPQASSEAAKLLLGLKTNLLDVMKTLQALEKNVLLQKEKEIQEESLENCNLSSTLNELVPKIPDQVEIPKLIDI